MLLLRPRQALDIGLHSRLLVPVLLFSTCYEPILMLQVHVDAFFGQLREGHRRFLTLSIRFHLLYVCLLLHTTLRVELAFLCEAFLSISHGQPYVIGLSNFLEGFVLGDDVVVAGETGLLHRLEHILLIEGKDAFLKVMLVLEVEHVGRDYLGRVEGLAPFFHSHGFTGTW